MYTYKFAYFGYPIDDYTRDILSAKAICILDKEYQETYDEGKESYWLKTAYHGGSDKAPFWIGVQGEGLINEAQPFAHVKLSNCSAQPTINDKKKFLKVFENMWTEVPEIIKQELVAIYGEPDFWVSEASS